MSYFLICHVRRSDALVGLSRSVSFIVPTVVVPSYLFLVTSLAVVVLNHTGTSRLFVRVMGRRAKHLTTQAKRAAKLGQSKSYRGDTAVNRANYAKRRSMKAVTLLGLSVPIQLLDIANEVYPASFSIHIEGPTLGLACAPYEFKRPDSSIAFKGIIDTQPAGPWNTTEAVLGAYQYNEIIRVAYDRRDRWSASSVDSTEIQAGVLTEIAERIRAWRLLWEDLSNPQDAGEVEMKQVALNWGAKVVWMLAREWEMFSADREGWCRASKSGNLPWQRMMKDTMAFYTRVAADDD
ncbi:hypothetical protein NUW54_g2870 [Trametes sanguinea]|uniref:Uncharacterized protein n=1 Tax=Trametes sanguinea TaxID=158606 RepID=A0ACC1Q2C2_9APHY|nr:hypothetical protein NUW54_g2870 [Trametes sanguinea]